MDKVKVVVIPLLNDVPVSEVLEAIKAAELEMLEKCLRARARTQAYPNSNEQAKRVLSAFREAAT